MKRAVFLFAVTVAASSALALADTSAQPSPTTESYEQQMAKLQDCKFVTDDCEVCEDNDAGQITCSSKGIGCEPKTWSCFVPKKKTDAQSGN